MSREIKCNIHKCGPDDCFPLHYPEASIEFPAWRIYEAASLLLGGPASRLSRPRDASPT